MGRILLLGAYPSGAYLGNPGLADRSVMDHILDAIRRIRAYSFQGPRMT